MAFISQYQKPEVITRQVFNFEPNGSPQQRAACVIGPAFELYDHVRSEKKSNGIAFSQGVSVPFLSANNTPKSSANSIVPSSVKIYGNGLEVPVLTNAEWTGNFFIQSMTQPNVLRMQNGNARVLDGSPLAPQLDGRQIQIGDIFYVTAAGKTMRRKVIGLRGRPLAASYGSNVASDDGLPSNAAYNPTNTTASFQQLSAPSGWTVACSAPSAFNGLSVGALLNGVYGEEFTATVVVAGAPGTAQFGITSKSGKFSGTITSTNSGGNYQITGSAIGGITVTISGGTVVLGNVFRFQVIGSYSRLNSTHMEVSHLGSGYQGTVATTYTVRVVQSPNTGVTGAVVSISDTAGSDEVNQVTVTANTFFNLGTKGLRFRFTNATLPVQNGLRVGDVYQVTAVPARESSVLFNGIVLDGTAVDTGLFSDPSVPVAVEIRTSYTGQLIEGTHSIGSLMTIGANSATLQNIYLPTGRVATPRNLASNAGRVIASWKAFRPATTAPIVISSTQQISELLGEITPDNDLAYAAFVASSAGREIVALITGGNTPTHYTAQLKLLESGFPVYTIASCSTDTAINSLIRSHVITMSSPSIGMRRKAYFGVDSPGSYLKLSVDSSGNDLTATVTNYDGQNVFVQTTSNVDLTQTVVAGDLFRIIVDGAEHEYTVSQVVSPSELILASGPVNPVTPAARFTVYSANTTTSQVAAIQQAAQNLAYQPEGRITVCWSEGAIIVDSTGNPTPISSKYLAAWMAGQRAANLPQQGLTNARVDFVASAAPTYLRYSRAELDAIASAGVTIFAQDAAGGGVYVRHQLTTSTTGGLLSSEDNQVHIADQVAFDFDEITRPFIGRRNVTAQTLNVINHQIANRLIRRTQTTGEGDAIGPMIVSFRDLTIAQHPVLKDRILIDVTVSQPTPINVIENTINYEIAAVTLTPETA